MLASVALFADATAAGASANTSTTSGAFISRPAGAFVRHDFQHRVGPGPLRVGLFDAYGIVSNEIGSQLAVFTDPAWLEAHVEIAAEPGFYFQSPGAAARTFGWRTIVRSQLNLNLKIARLWLYSRTTGLARLRNFTENDTFRGITIRRELSIEQATAVLVRVSGTAPAFWIYAEHTVGGIHGFGVYPHRVSLGLITEKLFADGLTLDLDLFYSFAPPPSDGPGVIGAFWYRW